MSLKANPIQRVAILYFLSFLLHNIVTIDFTTVLAPQSVIAPDLTFIYLFFLRMHTYCSERKPESENELINGLITFDENHRKRIEKTLIANAANDDVTLKKYEYDIAAVSVVILCFRFRIQSNDCDVTTSLKQKSAQLNINTVVDACHYRSFDRTNTDSDNNSTITCTWR